MATRTLGTNATTTLTALQWFPGAAVADIASIQALILDDGMVFSAGGASFSTGASTTIVGGPMPLGVQPKHVTTGTANPSPSQIPGSFLPNGQLIIPNRGVLRLLPGDFVGVDANGWPILVSAQSILSSGAYQTTSWTHS